MKSKTVALIGIVVLTLLIACAPKQREQYGSICGITIYSPSSNNLIVGIQNELLSGGHPTGAYEENDEVKFIYE